MKRRRTSKEIAADLLFELNRQAEDETNRTADLGPGAAALAYEHALKLVTAFLPQLHRASFTEGAKRTEHLP